MAVLSATLKNKNMDSATSQKKKIKFYLPWKNTYHKFFICDQPSGNSEIWLRWDSVGDRWARSNGGLMIVREKPKNDTSVTSFTPIVAESPGTENDVLK